MNDREVGEAEADAAILGSFDVPVGLVIGNSELESEIREWNADCLFVSTKRTLGPTAAVCKTPSRTQQEIRQAARAMAKAHSSERFKPYLQHEPITFVVETYRREMTDRACTSSTVERLDDRRFKAVGRDGAEAFRRMWMGLAQALHEPQSWMQ